MARDTVDKAVQVGALNDPRGCQTDGFLLIGGEAWHPTLFIRLVQDYGLEVEVSISTEREREREREGEKEREREREREKEREREMDVLCIP